MFDHFAHPLCRFCLGTGCPSPCARSPGRAVHLPVVGPSLRHRQRQCLGGWQRQRLRPQRHERLDGSLCLGGLRSWSTVFLRQILQSLPWWTRAKGATKMGELVDNHRKHDLWPWWGFKVFEQQLARIRVQQSRVRLFYLDILI